MTNTNLYDFLGVRRDASAEQINKVFREKALVLHPDKNRDDPEAAQKFKILMQAYQILTDPFRREKYDATLPTFFPDASGESNLQALWKVTAQRFFDQSDRYSPAIDALRISQPLLIDGEDMLVVGIEHEQASLIGYLSVSITHIQIRRILTELYGKPLDFRMISGVTVEEWQEVQATEQRAKQRRANAEKSAMAAPPLASAPAEVSAAPAAVRAPAVSTAPVSVTTTASDANWDEMLEMLARLWHETAQRTHALSRARYLLDALPLIARGEDMARAGGVSDEVLHNHLARAFERVSNLCTMESGVIALEYLRYRTRVFRGM